MRIIGSQRGAISLGSLIFLLVLGTGIYIAVKMAVPLIRNYQVQELFKNEVIRLKTVSEEDVRNNINLQDMLGSTALHLAAQRGCESVVRLLVLHGQTH